MNSMIGHCCSNHRRVLALLPRNLQPWSAPIDCVQKQSHNNCSCSALIVAPQVQHYLLHLVMFMSSLLFSLCWEERRFASHQFMLFARSVFPPPAAVTSRWPWRKLRELEKFNRQLKQRETTGRCGRHCVMVKPTAAMVIDTGWIISNPV